METIETWQDDSFDLIAWRYFGKVSGIVENIIALNSDLIGKEPFDAGITVKLPTKNGTQPMKPFQIGG